MSRGRWMPYVLQNISSYITLLIYCNVCKGFRVLNAIVMKPAGGEERQL